MHVDSQCRRAASLGQPFLAGNIIQQVGAQSAMPLRNHQRGVPGLFERFDVFEGKTIGAIVLGGPGGEIIRQPPG
jgi:hypothetical protein